ncbi:MAG TPA: hypothetical protein VGR61_02600, partial [Candidatus Dormibacteraeota bacterium]|nr:hypothetical protein [Candidatus Dormibacteraeota bacterium]
RTDPALIAFVAQQAAVDYPGNAAARNEAAFNVAAHFAARGNATPEMRHVLASIVVQHIEELALDADLPTNRPTNAAGGSMDFTLADLQQLLRLATTDPADMGRVLDATGAWAAAAMAVGAADQGTARVGRLYGVLASASDLQVRDAAAADEHRRRLIDSVDKVAGLIPVAGGPLVQAGVGAARVVAGEAVKGLAQTDETSVAVGNANAFNESMIRHLDYLAAAAALARDPARFSTRVAPPLVNDSGRWRLAREVEAPQEYRRWFSTYEGEFSETRSAMDTGYLVRGPRWTGH